MSPLLTGGAGTSGSQTVLIRASGPALIPYGVTGVLPDPESTVFNNADTAIASNAGWGTPPSNVAPVTHYLEYGQVLKYRKRQL